MSTMRWTSTVLVSLLMIGSCTSQRDPEGADAEGATEISVMVSGDPEELEAYRQVADGFEASQSGITVDLIEIAERDELITRLSTSIGGGSPPDLFLLNYRYYGQFQAKGAIEPLDPYLLSSRAFSEQDFYPEAMEAFRDDGGQTCMPQNVSSLVVYYNQDLFEAAGVRLPRPGWSWFDMVEAATKLTQDTDGDGVVDTYGLGVDPEIIRVAPFIWSNAGTLVDDEDDPGRFAISTPQAAQAMQAFIDLRAEAGVTPTDEEAESEDFESRFLAGSLAMVMESRKVVPAFRTIEDFEWNVAPLPVHQVPATVLHSDAYCMTAGAAHKDQAWRFLEFALGPQGQEIAAKTGRTVPSLMSVAESDAFLDPTFSPTNGRVFLDNIALTHAVPHLAAWPQIEDITNGLLEEAYYEPGGGEAPELIVAITQQTRDLFADSG